MSGSYKYCVVPKCTSTTVATPDKLFIHVPKDVKQRKAWLTAMRRADPLSNKTTAFVCEEHFNVST
jgi:THAP domain.